MCPVVVAGREQRAERVRVDGSVARREVSLADTFGLEFTDFETYLRDHGWEDKEGITATPGWVKAF